MQRYEIRALAREHFLEEWQRDGWEVDMVRGEVCVGDSWFPVEALPQILANHMRGVHDAERDAKEATARLMRERMRIATHPAPTEDAGL